MMKTTQENLVANFQTRNFVLHQAREIEGMRVRESRERESKQREGIEREKREGSESRKNSKRTE